MERVLQKAMGGMAVARHGQSRITIQGERHIDQSSVDAEIAVRINGDARTRRAQDVVLFTSIIGWRKKSDQEGYRPSGEQERGTTDIPERRTRPNKVGSANASTKRHTMVDWSVYAYMKRREEDVGG